MSVRVASIFMTVGLFALSGCVQQTDVRSYTSSQMVAGSSDIDGSHRSLSSAQLAALSNWIKTPDDWSGMSADIPDNPSIEVDLQDAGGQSDKLTVYQHDDGTATAYLYHGQRLVPLRRRLSGAGFAALKSLLDGQ